uniref:Splicing factor subunit n=1 Tax=Vannella robusta TaxID=1487602 RepID=A0A7S4MT87_9EUKA
MATRETLQSQLEHLQAKYVGTGHADITKHEWFVNQHRDTFSSYLGHAGLMTFFGAVENESVGRVRYNFLSKMILPCGPPPKETEDEDEDMAT